MRTISAAAVLLVVLGVAVGVQGPTTVAKAPERFTMRVVATGFASPWEIAWGPDGQLWVTEREAFRVVQVNPTDGMRRVLLTVHEVHRSVGAGRPARPGLPSGFRQGHGSGVRRLHLR